MTDLYVEGPDVDPAALRPRGQLVRELRGRQGQAVRRLQLRRLRDRRRDPVLPRREPRLARRPALGAQLGAVPRRDGRLRRQLRARRAHRRQPDGQAASSTASRCRARRRSRCCEKANGGPLPEIKFFNMGELTIGGHDGARAAPRHVRRARHGALRPVGRGRGRARGARRGGRRLRPAPGRLARLRDEHARVGLDPVPAAGRLHRRRDEAVPRVAAGERLRGDRLARRQLLLRRHQRLLPDAAGPRLRGRSSSSTTTSSAARRSRRSPSRRGARSRWPGTARTSRARWARCSPRATPRSTSTCRSRTTRPGRTTRCC